MYDAADWSHRGDYIVKKHEVVPAEAHEALIDPERIVIDPDYNSTSDGRFGSSDSRRPPMT